MNKMSRDEVYNVIDIERKYQFYRWSEPFRMEDRTYYKEVEKNVESYILYMEHFLEEARKKISTESGSKGALEELRKVVALGVSCFEQNGVPYRMIGSKIKNGRTGEELEVR